MTSYMFTASMVYPRPASAGARGRRSCPASSNPGGYGEGQAQQALLHKIKLLAVRHARNVDALQRLRSSAPLKAWEDDTDLPPPDRAVNHAESSRRRPSTGGIRGRSTGGLFEDHTVPRPNYESRRGFTRVVSSTKSSWKNEPTVVEPFRSMEAHAAAWERKIRQREEHDFQVRKEDEEAKARDRERLIVAVKEGTEFSGVIARSNEMIARRRERAAEAEANEEEIRKRCEFRARPAHIVGDDWQTIQERQAMRRKQRVQIRKEEMSSKSHLPRRMAMHALRHKASDADAGDTGGREKSGRPESCPERRSIPYDRIGEVLARRQRAWDKRLAAAKCRKPPVVPQILPMEERENMYRERAQERAQRAQDQAVLDRNLAVRTDRQRKCSTSSAPVVPRSTHSFLVKMARVRARREKETYDLKQEKKRELQRRARQQETSKAIAEVMRQMGNKQTKQDRRVAVMDSEQKAREGRERYHRALKENKARLQKVTADRPTLWQQHDAELRKETAKRMALSLVAERVFRTGPTIDSTTDSAHWKRGPAAYKIFDEEEMAVMGMSSS